MKGNLKWARDCWFSPTSPKHALKCQEPNEGPDTEEQEERIFDEEDDPFEEEDSDSDSDTERDSDSEAEQVEESEEEQAEGSEPARIQQRVTQEGALARMTKAKTKAKGKQGAVV